MTTNRQIKYSYFKSKTFFEKINSLLDQGYIIFDENMEILDLNYRFRFKEPPWNDLRDFCWFEEIMFNNCGCFNPDDTWTEVKKRYKEWVIIHPKDRVKIL